jgi:hypothetical protein
MSIRATVDIENNDLILTVDHDGLKELIELLMHPADCSVAILPGSKHPMTRLIGSLRIQIDSDDLVEIETGEDAASIAGNPHAFTRLARELSSFAEYNDLYEPGMHTHFDPNDSPASARVLRSDSRSLVIAGPVSGESGQLA